MKKKIFMISSFVAGVAAIAAFALAGACPTVPHGTKAGNESYRIFFDSTKNRLHEPSGNIAYDGEATVKTELGSEIGFSYYQLKGTNTSWHVLGKGGYFYNTDSIHGIESISITFNTGNASYSIFYSDDSSFEYSKSFTAASGVNTTFDFEGYKPNYFKLVNTSGSNLNIKSMEISFSCLNNYPNLTLLNENEDMGNISGGGKKKAGDRITITATPNNGYRFVGWYDGETLVSNVASYSFVIGNSDIAYSARFTYQSYNLIVTSEDETKGTVFGTGSYNYLDKVSIEAVPNDWYTFIGWYEGKTLISTDNPYKFSMPYADKNYVARFSISKYSLSLTNENVDLGSISGAGTFEYGSSVTITAVPNKGVSFIGWYDPDGELVSSDTTYSFPMPHENLSYSARFAWTPYAVSVSINNGSMGSVTGIGSYIYGQEVILAATPNEHYSFFGWYDGDTLLSQDSSYSFSMPDKSLSYTARFVKNYKINVFSDDESMGTVSAPEEWGEGLEVTVRASAKQGCAIDYWYDDDLNEVSEKASYTFAMPAHDINLGASFTTGYSFVVSSSNPVTGTVNDASGQYKVGSIITVKASCNYGYFKGWYDESGELISHLSPYSFTMPSNNYSLVGNFVSESDIKYASWPILSDDGKIIKYGLYPQTVVDDSSLTSSLDSFAMQKANGWYFYNGDYYAKATAKPFNSYYEFSNGTKIEYGKDYWFRCEPIEWKILDNDNGEYFVVSGLVLDCRRYNSSISNRAIDGKTVYCNNYQYSDIRAWLNGDFYGSAFALGNENVLTTIVPNSAYSFGSSSDKYACEDTDDKVFMLSLRDAISSDYGFSSSISSAFDRVAYATDYAKCQGICVYSKNKSSLWWLRSPVSDSESAWCVDNNGAITFDHVDYPNGVRPAMRINLF